jgi:hypothetical protein
MTIGRFNDTIEPVTLGQQARERTASPDETRSPEGGKMNWATYPDGLRGIEYLQLAEQFYQAHNDLPHRSPPDWPRYFMLCQSIELGLKAYLAHHGTKHKQLLGHDLKKLMTDADAAGLSIKSDTRAMIGLLAEAHKKHWPRYPRGHGDPADAGKSVFIIDQFTPSAREILDSIAALIIVQNQPQIVPPDGANALVESGARVPWELGPHV